MFALCTLGLFSDTHLQSPQTCIFLSLDYGYRLCLFIVLTFFCSPSWERYSLHPSSILSGSTGPFSAQFSPGLFPLSELPTLPWRVSFTSQFSLFFTNSLSHFHPHPDCFKWNTFAILLIWSCELTFMAHSRCFHLMLAQIWYMFYMFNWPTYLMEWWHLGGSLLFARFATSTSA